MTERLLELKEVQKDYRTYRFGREIESFNALDKLSFHVDKGQIFGFLGPNGAGKTTTIKCIVGILDCDGGSILINGENVEENRLESKKRIGFLPEQVGLYGELTPAETLRHYGGFYELDEDEIKKSGTIGRHHGLVSVHDSCNLPCVLVVQFLVVHQLH